MKKILLSGMLLISISLSSQIKNEKEFVEFGLSSASEKFNQLLEGGWTTVTDKQWSQDGKSIEEHKYTKTQDNNNYILYVNYIFDGNTLEKYYVTKVCFVDITIYNKWVANLKKQGYKFTTHNGNFIAMEEDYSVSYCKKSFKDGFLYEVSVITYQ